MFNHMKSQSFIPVIHFSADTKWPPQTGVHPHAHSACDWLPSLVGYAESIRVVQSEEE